MKKLFLLLMGSCMLAACASMPFRSACPAYLSTPSFFRLGEKLAAFKVQARGYGYSFDGILQIKHEAADSYEVSLFATVGGYRVLQAVVSAEKVEYSFLLKDLDQAIVRRKIDRFLKMLLLEPGTNIACKQTAQGWQLRDKQMAGLYYLYTEQSTYPQRLQDRSTLSPVQLRFDQYTPYEVGEIPHYLIYQDGSVELELALLTLKK